MNKKFYFRIDDISTYRSELMGWAILWIMMLHFTFTQIKPLGFIAQFGFAGVEIFMMVSGFGLYYSLNKNGKLHPFYKKRLLRIFPTYYFLGLFASLLLYNDNLLQYLFRYSTIGFWSGGIYSGWYIPSIVFMYLLSPYIKKLYDMQLFFLIAFICIVILVISYILVSNELITKGEPHFFLLYRIPAFFFGMLCAYWSKKSISTKYYLYFLSCGIPFFIILFPQHHQIYNYKYFSFLFLLPLIVLFFITVSKNLKLMKPIIIEI